MNKYSNFSHTLMSEEEKIEEQIEMVERHYEEFKDNFAEDVDEDSVDYGEEEEEYTGPRILTDSDILSIRKEDGNCYYITTSKSERFRTGENIIMNLSNKDFKNKQMYCIFGGNTEWYFSVS